MDTLAAYEGSTEAGRMEGEGIYTYEDGTKYVGQFKNGAFHGEGLCGNQCQTPTPSTRRCPCVWARNQKQTYLYPLCTATTPNVISLTVGDLKPAMASCDNNSSCDGCFRILSTK